MTKKDKLLTRLKSLPKDFTYDETISILSHFGFSEQNKGKTSGSRVEFTDGTNSIILHKPHGDRKEMRNYQLRQIIEILQELNYI